jgi:acyl carrier protein
MADMMTEGKTAVLETLIGMITEVLGEDDLGIQHGTSFKDDLAFQSIQFVALAELIQERYEQVDFVTWLSGKQVEEILALRVGDVADFITSSALGAR